MKGRFNERFSGLENRTALGGQQATGQRPSDRGLGDGTHGYRVEQDGWAIPGCVGNHYLNVAEIKVDGYLAQKGTLALAALDEHDLRVRPRNGKWHAREASP